MSASENKKFVLEEILLFIDLWSKFNNIDNITEVKNTLRCLTLKAISVACWKNSFVHRFYAPNSIILLKLLIILLMLIVEI
jgi:hypothetical protein